MGAGDRTPKLLHRTRSLIAALFMASFWLAAPAHAAATLPEAQTPTVDPAAVPAPLPTSTVEVAAAGAAVSATATEASGAVQRVVTGAADTVAGAGSGAQPALEATLPDVSPSIPRTTEPTGGAAPRLSPRRAARAARNGSPRQVGRGERLTDARRRSEAPSTAARRESLPGAPLAAPETPRVLQHIASPAGSIPAAPTRAPRFDLLVGGPSASGASASLLFGGLAVLLTALGLARPALRRRLPSRPAMSWPAAFVPLLERPG